MIKKIFYIVFLISSFVYSQNTSWVDITDYDLKFKIPEGFIKRDTLGVTVYVYSDETKIVSVVISNDDIHNDAELNNVGKLKKYYKGVVNGYASKRNSEVISEENYTIKELFFDKSILKINYDDGSFNYIDLLVLFLNDINYIITFQYADEAEPDILKEKDFLFDSLQFDHSFNLKNQLSNSSVEESLAHNIGYKLGEWFANLTILIIVILVIYFAFIKKRKKQV